MDVMKIKLTKGLFALVDAEDYDRVNAFKWCASLESRGTKFYAIRMVRDPVTKKNRKIRMHRFIMGLPIGALDERVVDHLNHDSLDNRKANLEVISQDENMKRSHGWKKKPSEEPCL